MSRSFEMEIKESGGVMIHAHVDVADGWNVRAEAAIKEMAAIADMPVGILLGPKPSTPQQERDQHKFNVVSNVRLKGWKRRVRRMRALMSKMARKGAKR